MKPADRLEAAGFCLRSTGVDQIDVYAPCGKLVATVQGDRIVLRMTSVLAQEVASLLIRYYA